MTIGEGFAEVLDRARAGDPAANEVLYRDLAPLVLGYLRATGIPDPEDVTSEVFVSVLPRLGAFEGDERHFRSWVLTIAHRRMADEARRRRRRPEAPVSVDALGDGAVGSADGEAEALARLRARGVLEVMETLTEDQRAALSLRVLADLPVRDIATIMGRRESAVKALLRRALATLERRLGSRDGDGGIGRRPGDDC